MIDPARQVREFHDSGKRVTATDLTRRIAGWRYGEGTVAQKIAGAILELTETGELASGAHLPAERVLAAELGVSRGSITSAYQLLKAVDRAEIRRGSGCRIRRPDVANPSARLVALPVIEELVSYTDRSLSARDLSSGSLPGLSMVADAVASLPPADVARAVASDGYEPRGLLALRSALADYHSASGLPTTADEVLVTSGSQQALELLSRCWLDPGDTVVLEDPSYQGAIASFRSKGARLITIPSPSRPRGELLDRILTATRPRFVYLLPTAHNPTGTTITEADRDSIVRTLARRGVPVVEDLSTAELLFDEPEGPFRTELRNPLSIALPSDLAISLGSLSKIFWGGLRIGWIRAPKHVIAFLGEAKSSFDLGSSMLSQMVALRLMSSIETAREERARQLRADLAGFTALMSSILPEWSWSMPTGGGGIWATVPGCSAVDIADLAKQRNVVVSPGPLFSPVGGQRDRLRLPFVRPWDLEPALHTLRGVWLDVSRATAPGR